MDLRLKNLTKVYLDQKTGVEKKAINFVDLNITLGKITGIMGTSGCGKSTLLKMIAGLIEPTYGQIFIGEDEITLLSTVKRDISFVEQKNNLDLSQNVLLSIIKGQKKGDETNDELFRDAISIAYAFGLEDFLYDRISTLSSNQQIVVAVAKAVLSETSIIVLDQVFCALDPLWKTKLVNVLVKIQRARKLTIIASTSDQNEIINMFDEVVLLDKGLLKQVGTPNNLYDNPTSLFTAKFMGNPSSGLFHGSMKDGVVYFGDKELVTAESVKEYEKNLLKAQKKIEESKYKINKEYQDDISQLQEYNKKALDEYERRVALGEKVNKPVIYDIKSLPVPEVQSMEEYQEELFEYKGKKASQDLYNRKAVMFYRSRVAVINESVEKLTNQLTHDDTKKKISELQDRVKSLKEKIIEDNTRLSSLDDKRITSVLSKFVQDAASLLIKEEEQIKKLIEIDSKQLTDAQAYFLEEKIESEKDKIKEIPYPKLKDEKYSLGIPCYDIFKSNDKGIDVVIIARNDAWIQSDNGTIELTYSGIEPNFKYSNIIVSHNKQIDEFFKIPVDKEYKNENSKLTFNLDLSKVYVFDPISEKRIY